MGLDNEARSSHPAPVMTTKAAPAVIWQGRIYRPVMFGLTVLIAVAAVVVWFLRWRYETTHGIVAGDYLTFVDYGRSWLAGDGFYRAYQLAGAYEHHDPALVSSWSTAPNYYPPPFALVCAALTVLPWLAWWAPVAIIAGLVVAWRPAPWTWPVIALLLCYPTTAAIVMGGGTTMWVVALVALGLRYHWPAVLIVLKPSFLPLAFIGIRHRSWWITAGVLALLSLALLPMWPDYVTAIRNAQGSSVLYSAWDLPFVLLPIVAWFGRSGEHVS